MVIPSNVSPVNVIGSGDGGEYISGAVVRNTVLPSNRLGVVVVLTLDTTSLNSCPVILRVLHAVTDFVVEWFSSRILNSNINTDFLHFRVSRLFLS